MADTTDAELLRIACEHASAFRELYDRHARRIYMFHVARTRDAEAARDLTAETFAQAWLSRRRFVDKAAGSALPWLFAIGRHVLAASLRKQRLDTRACEQLGVLDRLDRPAATAEPDRSWIDGSLDDLASLPPAERDAIGLYVIAGLPYEDVAQRLGTSTGAARVRVHRGLTRLRDRLNPEGETS
jgi:RNA polymerase sigma-70 factor (ECF subfamily)